MVKMFHFLKHLPIILNFVGNTDPRETISVILPNSKLWIPWLLYRRRAWQAAIIYG